MQNLYDIDAFRHLLCCCMRLDALEFKICGMYEIGAEVLGQLLNETCALRTLTRMVIIIIYSKECGDPDPFYGLVSGIEQMNAENIIECIEVLVIIANDIDRTQRNMWGRPDKALVKCGWLKPCRVSVKIEVTPSALPDVHAALCKRRFPLFSGDAIQAAVVKPFLDI
ncbi:hypothetical protein BDN70DRAFT_592222 [Pholiota conissans]|uniref:Uncharacterized protein n=1 Tax=Pholiota conissans TaxID=109636 RepID=A0A9P5ZDQ7_9AGAR|nr:hypothetical protein BDN70DRAFT_592222 [Pholiota conissans]